MGGQRLAGTVAAAALLGAMVVGGPSGHTGSDPAASVRSRAAEFPSQAQIVDTRLMSLPPVTVPPSTQPDGNQADVVFVNHLTGFLANSGGPGIGTDQGGVYRASAGGIERTTDGGASWGLVWSRPGASIFRIGFSSVLSGWAAGWQYPTAADATGTGSPLWLRTADGGANWSALTPAVPDLGQWWDWAALDFVFQGQSVGLAVIDPDANAGPLEPLVLRTTDGGRDWRRVDLHGWLPTGGLAFSGPSHAFATGHVWPVPDGGSAPVGIWTSYDSGLSWRQVMVVNLPFQLYAIDFPDPLHGYAAGGNLEKYGQHPSRALLASTDGGRTWRVRYESADSETTDQITRLQFVDSLHGWAATGGCSEGANGPCSGDAMVTGDGGRSWRITSQEALDFTVLSPSEIWAIDGGREAGVLVHTVDSGSHWSATVEPWAFGISSLAVSGSTMLAQTPVGAALSRDGGQSWEAFNPPLLAGRPMLDNGDPTAIAVPPDVILLQNPREPGGLSVSHDGGQHWTALTLPSDAQGFNGFQLAAADDTHAYAVVGNQLCMTGSGPIQANGKPAPVAQGMAQILTSADGGLTWSPQESVPVDVNGLAAAPGLVAFTGFAGGCQRSGTNILYLSRDNGRHWIQQILPTSCQAISVAAPATIWLTCTDNQAYLLVSRDGARTWTKLLSTSPNELPAQVLASGPSEAWAYGPAFSLWHTTDGGQTWTAQALPATLG